MKNWRNKSLSQLENSDLGNPEDAPTPLIKRCLMLHRIPLSEYSAANIRLMIGQNFPLQYLIPLAMEHLRKNMLVEADLYPGDLLESVLKSDPQYWKTNPSIRKELADLLPDCPDHTLPVSKTDIMQFKSIS